MTDRPDKFPEWATDDRFSEVTNNWNVVEPTDSKKKVGWDVFEKPARNYFNWLGRVTYLWIKYFDYLFNNLRRTSNGNGTNLINVENTAVELWAVDKTAPTHFLHAIGWKGTSSHTLNVVNSNTLTLGSQDANGTQAISGGTASNIVVHVKMVLP